MFENLSADATDAGVQEMMDREAKEKQEAKEEKKRLKELEKSGKERRASEGGEA